MEDKQWKYKIGSGKMPMLLTSIMLILFGGLSIWLYRVQNGAFLFTGALAVATLILLGATIHRFLFYKVLIGKEGFYYQTGRKNGKFYNYEKVEKAWISSGTAQNGFQEEYCNIEIGNGPVIRFQFFDNDKKGIKYLIKRAEVYRNRELKENNDTRSEEYLIDGKVFAKIRMVLAFILLAVVAVLDTQLIRSNVPVYFYLPGTAVVLGLILHLLIHQRYFRIQIGKQGFYYRTNPFNGQQFDYRDIVEYHEIKKVVRRRAHYWEAGTRSYYSFFEFTDTNGVKRKFQFEKPIHEREVNVLKERIGEANGKDDRCDESVNRSARRTDDGAYSGGTDRGSGRVGDNFL